MAEKLAINNPKNRRSLLNFAVFPFSYFLVILFCIITGFCLYSRIQSIPVLPAPLSPKQQFPVLSVNPAYATAVSAIHNNPKQEEPLCTPESIQHLQFCTTLKKSLSIKIFSSNIFIREIKDISISSRAGPAHRF